LAEATIRKYIRKEVLETLKRIAKKLGYKLLRRSLINAAVPGVSILIGARWNKKATKMVGKIAVRHFEQRKLNKSAVAAHEAAQQEKQVGGDGMLPEVQEPEATLK
jgi:hypothetical protein